MVDILGMVYYNDFMREGGNNAIPIFNDSRIMCDEDSHFGEEKKVNENNVI